VDERTFTLMLDRAPQPGLVHRQPAQHLPVSGAPVTVRLSQLGDRAVALGAAGLVPAP
jgi:hypothetical protein